MSLQDLSQLGPTRKQQDFFVLITMPRYTCISSASQTLSKFSKSVTVGANKRTSSAYNIICKLRSYLEHFAISSTYTANQSCTRVQISRSDPTRPTKIVTRPDPMIIHDGQKGFIIARCTLSSAYTQVTSSMKSASTLRTYQMHVPSVRTPRDLHAVAALYQLLPETLHCDD